MIRRAYICACLAASVFFWVVGTLAMADGATVPAAFGFGGAVVMAVFAGIAMAAS